MREFGSTFGIRRLGGRRGGGGAAPAFSPASLFADGEAGAWFEKSSTTAFKSTTDLTLCAVGDSNGFLIDRSQGAGYAEANFTQMGPELVTNGTFDTDLTGWTTITWVWDSGAARANQINDQLKQKVGSSGPSKTFRLRFDQEILSGTRLRTRIRNFAENSDLNFVYRVGSQSVDIIVQSPDSGLTIIFYGEPTDVVEVDNISVRELPGNHATQPTVPARPILRQTAGGVYYLEDDEVDDALNWIAPADTDYTVAYVNSAGTVTILTSQSLSGATNILLDPELVAYLAVDRTLTATETSGLTAYLEALA